MEMDEIIRLQQLRFRKELEMLHNPKSNRRHLKECPDYRYLEWMNSSTQIERSLAMPHEFIEHAHYEELLQEL